MSEKLNAIVQILIDSLKAEGVELSDGGKKLADYVALRAGVLASGFGEPGYVRALKAEATNVMIFAVNRAIDIADATDARLVGIAQGALGVGVRLLLA